MARYLSEEWFTAVVDRGIALPARVGLDLVVDIEVAGSPDGKVRYHEVWADGRLVDAGAGKHDDSTIAMTMAYADAKTLVGGGLDPDVAFMQGRLKLDGEYARWLFGFRPLLESDDYRDFRIAVAELTEFD